MLPDGQCVNRTPGRTCLPVRTLCRRTRVVHSTRPAFLPGQHRLDCSESRSAIRLRRPNRHPCHEVAPSSIAPIEPGRPRHGPPLQHTIPHRRNERVPRGTFVRVRTLEESSNEHRSTVRSDCTGPRFSPRCACASGHPFNTSLPPSRRLRFATRRDTRIGIAARRDVVAGYPRVPSPCFRSA